MYLSDCARITPDKPMVIGGGTGRVTTCAALERRSNQLAHALHDAGMRRGDAVGLLLDNQPRLFEAQWATLRSGLRAVQLDPALAEDELVGACGEHHVKAMIASGSFVSGAPRLRGGLSGCSKFLIVGGASPGWDAYEGALAAAPGTPFPSEAAGEIAYVWRGAAAELQPSIREMAPSGASDAAVDVLRRCGFDDRSVLLVTSPLWRPESGSLALAAQVLGGTVVMLEHFDARESLRLIERYRVSHGQWLAPALDELLELPEPIRQSYDVLSMRCALHAGSLPAEEATRTIIDWWGPILREQPPSWGDVVSASAPEEAQRMV